MYCRFAFGTNPSLGIAGYRTEAERQLALKMWDGLIIDGRKVALVPVDEDEAIGILGRQLEGLFLPSPKASVSWAEDKVKVRKISLLFKRELFFHLRIFKDRVCFNKGFSFFSP